MYRMQRDRSCTARHISTAALCQRRGDVWLHPLSFCYRGRKKKKKTPSLVCVSLNQSQPGGGGVTVPLQNRVRGTCFDETFTHGEARSE